MKKLLLFSCFEQYTNDNIIMNEFIEKNIVFLNLFDYDITVLDRTKEQLFKTSVERILQKPIKVIQNITLLQNEYDIYYTFGNFISFDINIIKNKEFIDFTNSNLLNEFNNKFYINYIEMNNFIDKHNINIYQFMSDPLDFVYNNSILLSPDTHNITYWDNLEELHQQRFMFFPVYQYYHHIYNKSENVDKEYKFIVGNTIFDKYRDVEFNTYLLNLYEKEKNNSKYNFFITGYVNYKYEINNFINHNEFFNLCNKTEFGLVLKTYSNTIISANKFHLFLSKKVAPILVQDCDKDSNYIPSSIRDIITIHNSIELYDFINNKEYDNIYNFISSYFKYYDDIKFYKKEFNKLI